MQHSEEVRRQPRKAHAPTSKLAVPAGASARRLALLRRQGALRPQERKPLMWCECCGLQRRLGRWWWPPNWLLRTEAFHYDPALAGALRRAGWEYGDNCKWKRARGLWYCEHCWAKFKVHFKQWYVENSWQPVDEEDSTSTSSRSSGRALSSTSTACSSEAIAPPGPAGCSATSSEGEQQGFKGGLRVDRWPYKNGQLMPGERTWDSGGGEGHFDFVEIGTSNYHTLTQVNDPHAPLSILRRGAAHAFQHPHAIGRHCGWQSLAPSPGLARVRGGSSSEAAASHPDGKPHAWSYLRWSRDPTTLRGLAVDMKQMYLDQLPELPYVEKVRAAIHERDGVQTMHHVPFRDVERWERIFCERGSLRGYMALRLARGCSALGRHRVLRKELGRVGLRHLIRTRRVRTRAISTLFKRHGVNSVGVLALDCEGHDCSILRGLVRACDSRPEWYPYWILFESNGMSDEVFGKGTERRIIKRFIKRGYEVVFGGGLESGKRDTALKRRW